MSEPLEPQPEVPATRTSQFGWAARARPAPAGDGRDDGDADTAQLRHVFGPSELGCGWSTLQ